MVLRSILTLLLVLLVLGSAGPLSGANAGDPTRRRPADGRVHLVASKRGAIVSGRNLAPGDRVAGSVTITNTGALPGSFTLRRTLRGSRRLADHLVLTMRERRRRTSRVVYFGSLARFHAVKLGAIGPGRARTFHFSVSFRSSVPNRLQRHRASVDFRWRAVQAS